MRKLFVRNSVASALLLTMVAALPSVCHAEPAVPARQPNLLWIIVDDLGWRDLGCYGSTLYETPNIDRLASEGARFTQAYAVYPRCVPSRFGMLTGKHPARFQGSSDGTKIEPGRDRTIGSALADAGYATFFCGKWHLGDGEHAPGRNGFDTTIAAGAAGATGSHFAPYNQTRRTGHTTEAPLDGLDDAPEEEYLADRLTEETIKFVRNQSPDQPFFAVLAHYAVHTPLEAKRELIDHYQQQLDARPKPEIVMEPESAGENQVVQNNPVYAGMVDSVDQGVGRLLECLDQQGLSDNTIVVLTSDHGGLSARGNNRQLATSNRPLRAGKGHLYEGGLRIPLIIRWPQLGPAGREIDTQVVGTDFFPTFLEMAGLALEPTAHVDGVSFAETLRDTESTSERPLFWHNPAPRPSSTGDLYSSAVRVGDWKLVDFPEEERTELYHLSNDLGEGTNLAEENAEQAAALQDQLDRWKANVGAAPPKAERQRKRAARQRQTSS